jgi:S-adenosylmethionine hydrolase
MDGDTLVAHVLYADRFGNLILDATAGALEVNEGEVGVSVRGQESQAVRGATFADGAGGLVVYGDSSGRLGVALDGGNAAAALGAGRDDELRIAPAS